MTGDFNRDGKLDFVSPVGGSFNTFLGNGDGTFQATLGLQSTLSDSVVSGDFNGDGIADLALTYYNGVGVLLGKGDGTFDPEISYATGSGSVSLTTGDFNGDGIADLAVANRFDANFSILPGKGDGTFGAALNQSLADPPYRL